MSTVTSYVKFEYSVFSVPGALKSGLYQLSFSESVEGSLDV
jgi:hypothetical protein